MFQELEEKNYDSVLILFKSYDENSYNSKYRQVVVLTAYVSDRQEPQDPPNNIHFLIPLGIKKNEDENENENKNEKWK